MPEIDRQRNLTKLTGPTQIAFSMAHKTAIEIDTQGAQNKRFQASRNCKNRRFTEVFYSFIITIMYFE
jgi:hypothetical protein